MPLIQVPDPARDVKKVLKMCVSELETIGMEYQRAEDHSSKTMW